MAFCRTPFPAITNYHCHHYRIPPPSYSCSAATTSSMNFCPSSSSSSRKINLYSSLYFKRNSWSGCCHATGPESEPSSKKHPLPSSGVTAAFTRFQDTLRIFFAVLFWMSLFFWSSAWGGGDGGRGNKGSRFRK